MKARMIQRVPQAHLRPRPPLVHRAKRLILRHFHKTFAQVHEVLELFFRTPHKENRCASGIIASTSLANEGNKK